MKVNVFRLTCTRCDHKWTPRVQDVRVCPNCHSYKWDVPRETSKDADEGK